VKNGLTAVQAFEEVWMTGVHDSQTTGRDIFAVMNQPRVNFGDMS